MHPFQAPAHEIERPAEWGPLVGFLWQRGLRLVAAPLVAVTLGMVLLPVRPGPGGVALLAALGVLLYLPTTLVLFRTRFLPRDPDLDEIVLGEGERLHAGDYLAVVRARAAEEVLGSLPFSLLAVYAIVSAGVVGAVIGAACLAFAAYNLLRVFVYHAVGESSVALARGRLDRAVAPVARALRLPLPSRFADPLWHHLAVVRFREGRIGPMLDALDRIARPEVHGAHLLRAQALAGLRPDEARALVADVEPHGDDEEAHEAVLALLALHDGAPETVRAQRPRWEAERDVVTAHRARFRDLVLAAALADREPEAAVALLRRSRWSSDRLPWLRAVWPVVGERLGGLQGW